ncbi:MAG: hypothetical protein ACLGSD_12765 [Acidobacteriota bacterium]
MKDLGEAFEQLSSRVDALEQRVARLENSPAEESLQAPTAASIAAAARQPAATPQISDTFAVFGKALLGIAGAYVLRALADGTSIARPLIAAAGIVYALAWLLAAARVSAKKLAPAFYAATSALILVPMLWEMCLRFHVLSAGVAAIVLAAYTAVSAWIGWRTPKSPAFALSYAGAATAAVMLSIATHAMAAFTLLLLAMLLACEIGRFLSRDAWIRAAVALATDFAVWTLLFIYRAPAESRSDYPSLRIATLIVIGCMPFVISFPGIVVRTLRLRRDLTMLDIVHGMLSFILVALTFLWILPGGGAAVFGVLCAVLAIACYIATLGPLRGAMSSRNFAVAALWSAALMVSAAFLFFSTPGASVAFCALAIGGVLVGDRLHCRTAELHGVLYLGIAVVLSGQLAYAWRALVGAMQAPVTWPVLVASLTAIAAYVASDELPSEPWQPQILHFVPAVLAGFSAAALLAHALVRSFALLAEPANFHIAFLRTVAVCLIAVTLAFGAAHWRRLELKRVAYIALAFVAAKLIFEDLRHGHLEFTAASIGLVALTVIAVPRLAQRHPA